MSGSWGQYLKVTLFGESHGPAIGVTIDGLPAGFEPDLNGVRAQMKRRAPGQSTLSTPRAEADEFTILSGMYNGKLTGTPLTAVIENKNAHSGDYDAALDRPRPGHADLTGHIRYKGFEDPRGGGHFSGRLTAPIVLAGALTAQWLRTYGIHISAKAVMIGGVAGGGLTAEMTDAIMRAKADGDSVGGVIECVATRLPAGLGAPFFGSVESVVSQLLFSIPAVVGVEFGDGFARAAMRGSQSNDQMAYENGVIKYLSNHAGGALGGITNGEPLVVRAAIKPTPSIARTQSTVSLALGESAAIAVSGRHDPCIVPRAVPVVESAVSLALGELMKERLTWND